MSGRFARWIAGRMGLLSAAIDVAEGAASRVHLNEQMRLGAMESSLRLIEKRLSMIEKLRLAEGEVGEIAARRQAD